ncbi:MAG TPA: hypothetical protein VF062_22380 [Candidatus Limnocylindrales bacterium]
MSDTLTQASATIGQRVTLVASQSHRYPGVWTITGKGPKNATLTPAGGGRGLRCPYAYLIAASDETASTLGVPYVPQPLGFFGGEVVTVAGRTGLWVVFADKGARVNVHPLGGDGGRYLRCPPESLTRVPLADVASHLSGS